MDLEILKGLKITDEKDKATLQQPQTTTDQPKQEHLFDKLSSAFSGEKPPPPLEPEHQGLFDKLSHAIGGHSNPPQPPSQPVEPKHEDFLTKASHLFGEKSKATPPPPPPEPKHENLVDRITGALAGDRHEVAQPPPPPEHKNILERIGDAFSGEKDTPPPPPPAPKFEGLSDKIHAVLHGGEEKTGASQTGAGEDKKDINLNRLRPRRKVYWPSLAQTFIMSLRRSQLLGRNSGVN
ncbi:hypothetical protein L218DRAFT_126738 [Marasmius fiardii PR-910]|nr:hypothetical protein L218DRAFT_126738 [Marasmius fiardii PR-910]